MARLGKSGTSNVRKIGIYLRVSTTKKKDKDKGKDGKEKVDPNQLVDEWRQDPEVQLKRIVHYISSIPSYAHKPLPPYTPDSDDYLVFTDRVTGSGKKEQPGLEALLSMVRSKDISTIVVYKIDRLGRSMRDVVNRLHLITKTHGGRVISVTQNLDIDGGKEADPLQSALVGMLVVFAEFELETIRERVKDGIELRRSKGLPVGGANKRRLVDRERLRELREKGWGVRAIARELKVSKSVIAERLKEI